MPSEQAKQRANSIFNDLRGAAYYADPKILGGYLGGAPGTEQEAEGAAVEVLRFLLRRYATEYATDRDVEQLAELIDRA